MIEEVKSKYQEKLEEQKAKVDEALAANEGLRNEIVTLKEENEELIANHERIVGQLHSDMRIIKEEWERKCQEIALNLQKEIVFYLYIKQSIIYKIG